MGCIALEKIEIPYSVKYIRANAFRGCSSLTHLRLSEIPKADEEKCAIDEEAEDLILHKVEKIEEYAFYKTGFPSIKLNNARYVHKFAFGSMENLTRFKSENEERTIWFEYKAFDSNPSLKNVIIKGEWTRKNYMSIFENCPALENVANNSEYYDLTTFRFLKKRSMDDEYSKTQFKTILEEYRAEEEMNL